MFEVTRICAPLNVLLISESPKEIAELSDEQSSAFQTLIEVVTSPCIFLLPPSDCVTACMPMHPHIKWVCPFFRRMNEYSDDLWDFGAPLFTNMNGTIPYRKIIYFSCMVTVSSDPLSIIRTLYSAHRSLKSWIYYERDGRVGTFDAMASPSKWVLFRNKVWEMNIKFTVRRVVVLDNRRRYYSRCRRRLDPLFSIEGRK